MIEIKKGITRKVYLIGKYAFKIPNTSYSHHHFLKGCQSNWSERKFCKDFKEANYKNNPYNLVAPSLYCLWFGLLQIQIKCKPLERNLTKKEKEIYKTLCGADFKKQNFGWYKGKIVCLDYP